MSSLFKVATFLFYIFAHGVSYSQTEEAYSQRVDTVTQELGRFDKAYFKFLERSEINDTVAAYRKALGLIEEIATDTALAAEPKSTLLLSLAEACGAMFERLTEPFADVKAAPLTWTELSERGQKSGAGAWLIRAGRYTIDRIVWQGQSLFRDFLRAWPLHFDDAGKLKLYLPFALPYGSDRNRSKAANEVMKESVAGLKAELDKSIAGNPDQSGLVAMKEVMTSMEKAEPIKWGPANNRFRRFLLFAAAPYFLLNPPVDFWWFTVEGPTQYSLLVSSIFEVGAVLYLGRVRNKDSALEAYWTYDRAMEQMKGNPSTRLQKIIAWTRLSKVPGLEFLGRGLEKNKEYAKASSACDGVVRSTAATDARLKMGK